MNGSLDDESVVEATREWMPDWCRCAI